MLWAALHNLHIRNDSISAVGADMNKLYKLYANGRNGAQTLVFRSVAQRRRFLVERRGTALKNKLQILYKGTEYLRIYNNCVLYQEYDIKARPANHKQAAERLFNNGSNKSA